MLSGCGGDKELMEKGLMRSGMEAGQAKCFAEKMAGGVETEIYDYLAKIMNEGVAEKEAVNKARRKFGADFKTPMEEARTACVK